MLEVGGNINSYKTIMKKYILFLGLLSFSITTTAQIKIGGESEIRKLVGIAKEFNFIRDW